MKESEFQAGIIREIRERLPDAIVLKNDSGYRQGIPDLIVLHGKRWAALECKKNKHSPHQPNQDYYINRMDNMSLARFIYPENKEEVLNDMERSFED